MSKKEKKRKSFYKNFAMALVAVVTAAVVTSVIPVFGGGKVYFLFLAAIIYSTIYGDASSGGFALLLSILFCYLLFEYPGQSPDAMGLVMLLAFGVVGFITVIVCRGKEKSETARRIAESRYRAIFEDAITGIYVTTTGGAYVVANPKLAEILGYASPADLMKEAENLNDRFYVCEGRRAEFQKLVDENENVAGFESEIYRRDGEKIWITENSVSVRDENGGLLGFQGTTIEITDRKRAETELQKARAELEEKVSERTAELRQSEEKFRALVEVSSELIWEVDENNFYTYVSPKVKEFLGYEPEEILGRKSLSLMPPDEARRVSEIFKQFGGVKESFVFLEAINIHKNGTAVVTETSGVPFFDAAGKFRGYRGVVRDVTERKRSEAALQESQLRLRSVVTAAPIVLFALDCDGTFTLSEGNGLELLNLRAGEVVGQSAFEFYREMPSITKNIRRALAGETFMDAVAINDLIFETRYSPILDEKGNVDGIIGVSIDATERKRIENELLASQRQRRELSAHLLSVREEERKRIARQIHDELGQTLIALKIDLTRMSDKISNLPDLKVRAQLGERLPSMLEILDAAMEKIRSIIIELRPGVLDELGLAAAVEWQVQDFQKRTGIECSLRTDFAEEELGQDLMTAMFRILQECLVNIARHSSATRAKIKLRKEKDLLTLQVEDDGRGITPAELEKRNSFGILGMRERASLLGGALEIEPVGERKGTRVTIRIPSGGSAQNSNSSL